MWHSYPHPDRLPFPQNPGSTPISDWPSWFLRAVCACGQRGYVSLLHVKDQAQTVNALAGRAKCRKCGDRPIGLALVTTCLEADPGDRVEL